MSKSEQADHLNKETTLELVKLLYTGSKFRPVLHIVSIIILVPILIGEVPLSYIATWVVTLTIVNIYRFIDINNTQKIIDEIKDYQPLQKRFALSASLLGLTYSLGIIIVFSQLNLVTQIYLLCFFSTLIPAGLVSFASDRYAFYGFFYSLCAPLVLQLFLMASSPYINIGICCLVYIAVCRKLFIWNYDVIKRSIQLKLKNIQLMDTLSETNGQLKQQNNTDELTKVSNRRYFDEVLEKEWLRAKRTKAPLSILMIDIDYFKQYNDTFGHIEGDECLKRIAETLSNNLNRPGDFVARYGGEEFCIIMPETNLNGAVASAEKIHSTIIELKIKNPGSEVSRYLSISIGVAATIPKDGNSYMDLIYTSDKALYKAKKDGRNIVRTMETLEKNPGPRLVI